jgi:TonB family protein
LLIVSGKKIETRGQTLDIKLQSGDHIDVPARDVNDHATEVVRAALRSQSPRLHLIPPERVVVLNVASLTDIDNHGQLTVTLSSGATIHCRDADVRPDPHLMFLRTILTADIYTAATTNPVPPVLEGFQGLALANEPPAAATATTRPQTGVPPTDHPFGPSFEFDTKGVDFGFWLRGFKAQIYRNWLIPYAAMNLRGHVVLRFTVHRDGTITDLVIIPPSAVDAFTKGAFNALQASNPTVPLPQEYPDEKMVMTVIFYYNEEPAKSSAPGEGAADRR